MYWNVNAGWVRKFSDPVVVPFFDVAHSCFDVLVVPEPWIHSSEIALVQARGWTLFSSLDSEVPFSTVSYRGLLIYVRDSLLHLFSIVNLYENSFIDIVVAKFLDFTLIFCYIPPVTSRQALTTIPNPLDTLISLFSLHSDGKLVVVGDLNAQLGVFRLDESEDFLLDTRGRLLLQAIESNFMLVLNGSAEGNTGYTFLRGHSFSCLDYVLWTAEDAEWVEMELHGLCDLSDHKPVEVVITIEVEGVDGPADTQELPYRSPPDADDGWVLDSTIDNWIAANLIPVVKASYSPVPVRSICTSTISSTCRKMTQLLRHPDFGSSEYLRNLYKNLKFTVSELQRTERRNRKRKLLLELEDMKGSKSYWDFVRKVFLGKVEVKGSAVETAEKIRISFTNPPSSDHWDVDFLEAMQLVLELGPQQIHPLLDEPFECEEIAEAIKDLEGSADGVDGVTINLL